jgi:hypothetical protein
LPGSCMRASGSGLHRLPAAGLVAVDQKLLTVGSRDSRRFGMTDELPINVPHGVARHSPPEPVGLATGAGAREGS